MRKSLLLFSTFRLISVFWFFSIAFYAEKTPAYGQSVGTTTGDILKINSGARPAAMGGVYTAMGDDAYAVEYNPVWPTFLMNI
jgi:hypothetical protein